MADMIHNGSVPATLPILNVFAMPDTQTAVRGIQMVTIYPVAPATMSSVTQFNIPGAGKDYIDTERITLHMKVKYVEVSGNDRAKRSLKESGGSSRKRRAGTPDVSGGEEEGEDAKQDQTLPVADPPVRNVEDRERPTQLMYPINFVHHTAWRQIDVEANNINLIKANNLYPYESMFKVMLRYGYKAKRTHLQSMGYYDEEQGLLDDIALTGRGSVIKRVKLYSDGKTVDLEGPLMVDALQLNGRPLLNGVNLVIKLYPSDKAFYTMTNMEDTAYTMELVDIYLKVCKVQVSDSIILAHSVALEKSSAVYPFTGSDTKSFTYGQGLSNISINNVFNQTVPSRIVFGFVSADAFNGNVTKNPFNFKHYDVADIGVTVDGLSVGKPLQLSGWDQDNDEGRQYVDAYNNLFQVSGTMGQNGGNNITIDQFAQGFTLFAFNLEPEMKQGNYLNLTRSGNVRLEIRFKKPLPEPMVAVIYGEQFRICKIDSARNVSI